MHFTTALTIVSAFVAQVVFGWHIAQGTAEGVYSVEVFDNGTEHHVRLRDLPNHAIPRAARSRYASRPPRHASVLDRGTDDTNEWCTRADQPCPWSVGCYLNEGPRFLDPRECDLANAGIDAQCGNGAIVTHNKDFYSIAGCSVAYVCHFWGEKGGDDGTCTADERKLTSKMITDKCGLYIPGSATQMRYYPGEKLQYNMTYGYEAYCTSWGHDFCGRGTG
ncbi:hypothetical protein CONLIGDRAFT_709714 [Coniochaeta ligniaria NRRL 30616]|uniref:Uncharacterized protein n=1 Tax=Coniochaeta ligniaria NRRL 30616 TaxID=1408157 RepID=A0A1J7J3K9_9PEZI|nr:hypothetical protein CONLIGDRAFT_709714 [Coniochaeta ligniaria NRRL 30616]